MIDNMLPSSKPGARQRKPSRNRLGHYLFVILGSGAVAALLAIVIAATPTVLSYAFPAGDNQIQADQVFPSVSPVHQVVNVYDPPTSAPKPPPSTAAPVEHESPAPVEHESPEPNDN